MIEYTTPIFRDEIQSISIYIIINNLFRRHGLTSYYNNIQKLTLRHSNSQHKTTSWAVKITTLVFCKYITSYCTGKISVLSLSPLFPIPTYFILFFFFFRTLKARKEEQRVTWKPNLHCLLLSIVIDKLGRYWSHIVKITLGFFTVSSTLRMRHAASVAALMAFI